MRGTRGLPLPCVQHTRTHTHWPAACCDLCLLCCAVSDPARLLLQKAREAGVPSCCCSLCTCCAHHPPHTNTAPASHKPATAVLIASDCTHRSAQDCRALAVVCGEPAGLWWPACTRRALCCCSLPPSLPPLPCDMLPSPAASALVLMRFPAANQSSCAAAGSCCCSWCTPRCRVTPAGCRRRRCCYFLPSSAVSEQQQAQHQQTGRSTCQAGICGILLGLFVVASHVGHVLEALVLVWDFVSVAHNPAQAR